MRNGFDLLLRNDLGARDLLNGFFAPQIERNLLNVRADISENDKAFTIRVDVPGVSEKELSIDVAGDRLTISGERKSERDEKSVDTYHVTERTYGHFERSFEFAKNANLEAVEAKYKDGVLTVTVPKAEVAKARKITISTSHN